jgi:hypothetical protein
VLTRAHGWRRRGRGREEAQGVGCGIETLHLPSG